MRRLTGFALLSGLVSGCGGDASGEAVVVPDAAVVVPDAAVVLPDAVFDVPDAAVVVPDAAVVLPDAAVVVTDAAGLAENIPPDQYCETVAPFFCDFYVRCGRMAVDSVEACLPVFAAACDAGYEPQYIAHANRGLLTLSGAGITACRAHLETVACEAQVFDLDGACAGMWVGGAALGAACAPGIGSFVCAPGGTCVLGLDFCGVCEAAAATGAPCGPDAGEVRCGAADRCAEGLCVPRTAPGGPCAADEDCVVAAACVEGTCRSFDRARAGEACGADRRCPYHSTCRGGRCEVNRTLGETCAAGDVCDAGRCVEGVCVALRGEEASCTADAECLSGACSAQGACGAPLSDCL